MARQNHGPLSRAKGKLGGVVYQQYEGMQISREYQPVVKNPQTTKQTENRAKFKLASQITAEFKNVISKRFANLSIYERSRRAASVNAIYHVINTTQPDTPEALVADVVSALNAKSVSGIAGPIIDHFDQNTCLLTAAANESCTYCAVSYDPDGKPIKIETENYTSDGTGKTITAETGAKTMVVMAVCYHALTEAGRAVISNLSGSDTAWSNEISRAIASGDIEISNLSGIGGAIV